VPERNDVAALVAVAGVVTGLDQLTKAAVVATIGPGQPSASIELLGSWLALEYVENRGVAFGLFAGLGPILLLLSCALLAGLLIHYAREARPSPWQTLAIGMIVGGAAGNLIDRVRLGYVVDFVAVGAWPNFNVADSAITCGVILMIAVWFLAGDGSNAAHAQ
jgi:signal peptidase II